VFSISEANGYFSVSEVKCIADKIIFSLPLPGIEGRLLMPSIFDLSSLSAEFETGLRRSRLLLCPLHPATTMGPVEERYGTIKGTGNVFDAIRAASPLMTSSSA
jgi:hypothetical protein